MLHRKRGKMIKSLRVAFLVSGGGTTMEAILKAITAGTLTGVTPTLVIASKPGIEAIDRAKAQGIPEEDILVVNPRDYTDSLEFGANIVGPCILRDANFAGQYGWLPLTPRSVIGYFGSSIINQHPAPLDPAAPPGFDFGGRRMVGMAAMEARRLWCHTTGQDWWTEAVAHQVTPDFDRGEVLDVERVAITPGMVTGGKGGLKELMSRAEHVLQIRVLQRFVDQDVQPLQRPAHWLVKPEQRGVLDACKTEAITRYPRG